jgi:hypothetical protein
MKISTEFEESLQRIIQQQWSLSANSFNDFNLHSSQCFWFAYNLMETNFKFSSVRYFYLESEFSSPRQAQYEALIFSALQLTSGIITRTEMRAVCEINVTPEERPVCADQTHLQI